MATTATLLCIALWAFTALAECEGPGCEASKGASLLQARFHKDHKDEAADLADELAKLTSAVSEMQHELRELKDEAKDPPQDTLGKRPPKSASDGQSALLKKLHHGPNQDLMQGLSPTCAHVPRSIHPMAGEGSNATGSIAQTSQKLHSNQSIEGTSTSTCNDNELKLLDFAPPGVTSSCCGATKMECSGCASSSQGVCQKCEGGFVQRGGVCVSCASSSNWVSETGLSCLQISTADCNDHPVRGQSSNQACCTCGGGHVTPTPFEYPHLRWSLSSNILLRPEPRTADRYTVDSACELAAHNLTLDGSTGVISYAQGKMKPKEAFNFQCEVTAHQAPGVSLIAVVTLAADHLNYKSETLVFHDSTTETPLGSESWTNFAMTCAPELPWLQLNSNTGELSMATGASTGGVSVANDFYGQDGAVCVVTAWLHHGKESKQYSTSFAALKPRPWPSLQYDLSSVSVSLGQELPPLKPQTHHQQGLMKPFTFDIACSVTGSTGSSFFYDRLLHMGFVDGHSVLELDLDGQLTVAPADTLTQLFDASTQDHSRKSITLDCRIFGIFPDIALAPVETTLSIRIQDSICWVSQTINGVAILDAAATSLVQCRSRCRTSEVCANYRFASGSCLRYDVRKDGQEVTVNAKVTNCTEGSCMQVQHDQWYLAGRYCPMGYDGLNGGIMYRREHVTPQDAVYLYKHRPGDGCSSGQWILQKVKDGDYADASRNIFEFKGQTLACLPENKVDFALNACPTAMLIFEQDEEELPALVLDDPGTLDPADYWLHPCDCASPSWATEAPVNAESFEDLPADSHNDFIPSPYTVVSGQLVCPSRQLLPNGIHFQTEEELQEPSDCESRCRDDETCQFFWHGSQHGAATCRLFSGCDSLVREYSLEGDLKVLPRSRSCQVADADACWATSLRRSFLSMSFDPSGTNPAQPAESSGSSDNIPPKPDDPPAEGMVSWFKSENAGSVWPSSVGNFEGKAVHQGVTSTVGAGYGADRPVTFIKGREWSGFDFGKVIPPTFSMCTVARYTGTIGIGEPRRRIFQTKESNFLFGHWDHKVGVAFFEGWVTLHDSKPTDILEWVVMCGTNVEKRTYIGTVHGAANIATSTVEPFSQDQTLVINAGAIDENSAFAVMEVITWNRALSDDEMVRSVEYLKWKLRAGAALEPAEYLARFFDDNFHAAGAKNLDHVQDQTFHETLYNGYPVTLSGWTHTRDYAGGYLRNINGKATAVVSGLIPSAQYLFNIYTHDSSGHWHGNNLVSVNHGAEARVKQDAYKMAQMNGVATANPRGEITFEFDRDGTLHVHLSGIAVAKVAGGSSLLQRGTDRLQRSLQRSQSQEAGFDFLHLYQQCDAILLLGGMGVQSCGRPSHRTTDSHTWKHKRTLPSSFQHGSVLLASCWAERYRLFRQNDLSSEDKLQCVSGHWYNSLEKPGLQGLSCESCMQVGAPGYAAYNARNEQELYFFNRMALSVYTELGMITELSTEAKHKHCLKPSAADATEMTVVASSSCSANLLAQVNALSTPANRHFRIIPSDLSMADPGQCLSAQGSSVKGLVHHACNKTDEKQLLSPAEIPSDIWALHVKADERSHDLHKAYSSFCGTSGALSNLDFGQMFVGDSQHIATKCKFAPLVNFGSFVTTEIIRDKTSSNWHNWHKMLADNPVECESGEALTGLKLDSGLNKYKYECSKIGGLGACFDYYSAQVEVPLFDQRKVYWEKPMQMLQADCGENSVLGGFHFEFSEGGKWQRVRFKCCKAGGAPVTMDPRGQVPDLVSPYDGVFCPSRKGASGRFEYESSNRVLKFDRGVGKWCLGTSCSKVTSQASPLEVAGADFAVVNVSDFNGEFVGAGIPGEPPAKALSIEDALKLKPPRRPPQPPMPELEEFKAEQPKYASECLNYENLWKEVSETFMNEEEEEEMTISKLEAEPATKEASIPDYHPCEVAKNAGGIFGPYGGGDGSTAPENMMYSDWNDCMQGDIERDLVSATASYHGAMSEFVMDMVEEGLGVVCSAIPDVMIAPFGAGVALNPAEICGQVAELVGAIKKFAGPASSFHFAKKEYAIQQEGYAACNPLQIGFARAFCDIHCVRDAVIRGDRSIIRNLELATKKTNNNLQKMVKWSVDANRAETGFLADKLDYMHAINFAYLSDIKQTLSPQSSLEEVRKTTDRMFEEMQSYGESASFDELSRITANDALQKFLESPDLVDRSSDVKAVNQTSLFLNNLDALHQTMQRASRGRSRSEILSRQMARQVARLQQMARQQLNTLGVYRMASNASAMHGRHLATMLETASLDRIWWQFRVKLDAYLDVAEAEVKSFQKSLEDLERFNGCKSVFSNLVATYTRSMKLMTRSHRKLRSTWREASGLLGELASVLVDTDTFGNFIRDQGVQVGCSKAGLMEETMKQVQSAIFGMGFLRHRFQAAQLPAPHMDTVRQAVQRLREAYTTAVADHCK